MDIFPMVIASLAVGFVVGVLSGLLGIGGGTILVPTFRLGYGLAPLACTATSMFTIIPTSIAGAISHIRQKTCLPKLGAALGLGGACTSPLGVMLASWSPEWLVMVVTALIIGYSAFTMLRKAFRMGKPAVAEEAAPAPAKTDGGEGGRQGIGAGLSSAGAASADEGRRSAAAASPSARPDGSEDGRQGDAEEVFARPAIGAKQLVQGVAIGLLAGVASGYVGLGGGFLIVPMMSQLMGLPMRYTSGTSLIAVLILAIPGTVTQALLGNVHWLAGIAVALGSIPGALLGTRFFTRIPERTLRFMFGGLLMVAALSMVLQQMGII